MGVDRDRSLAVVVVNFGACALLERNLTRVADGLPVPGRVYVVDNWHSAAERAAGAAQSQGTGDHSVAVARGRQIRP